MPKKHIIITEEKILLIKSGDIYALPDELKLTSDKVWELNENYSYSTLAIDAEEKPAEAEWVPLRNLPELFDDEIFQLAGKAKQLLHWQQDHQFCGRCGAKTQSFDLDRAKKCTVCDLVCYPRIAPCIMVAITRGDEILLARSPHFRPGIFSVLAGFVEPGETLEECIHREVMEEVGLKIKNLRYEASQPWPFPNLLMIGFFAEYAGGEINIDGIEIEEAQWFKKDSLPPLPSSIGLSYRLIQKFLA